MILSKLVIALISPLGTALAFGVLALFSAGLGKRRFAYGMGAFAVIWLGAWSMPPVSMGLRGLIESQFPAPALALLPSAPAIVVLGGVLTPASVSLPHANLSAAADRLRFAAQLYHSGKAPLVVLSGGSDLSVSKSSEAVAMQAFLHELGVPHSAMLLEEQSRTTQQNAHFTSLLLRSMGIDRVLLVTSALHMRRAKALFEAEGLQVIPAATDHEARALSSWQKWLPDADALDGSARALKEWVGWFAVRLSSR